MAAFLEVKNVSVAFGKEKVLDNISFSLEEGETLAIIGPNGAGKTTLLKVLIDAIPYRGEIVWHKSPIVSYVPQRFWVEQNIPLSVKEFFLLHRRISNLLMIPHEILSDIKRVLVHVNAHNTLEKHMGELSSGQLQRVLIAYALFGNPNLILFDEPTAGIDLEGQTRVYDLLEHLLKEFHLSLILVSHDLNVVYRFADKVVCINKQLFCQGRPQEVLTPEHMEQLYGRSGFYVHAHE